MGELLLPRVFRNVSNGVPALPSHNAGCAVPVDFAGHPSLGGALLPVGTQSSAVCVTTPSAQRQARRSLEKLSAQQSLALLQSAGPSDRKGNRPAIAANTCGMPSVFSFMGCMYFMISVMVEVELFMADEMVKSFCSRQRKGLRRHLGEIDKIAFLLLFFWGSAGTNGGLRPLI